MQAPAPSSLREERLCLACGLCCDGTLFDVVRIRPGEAAHAAMTALGIPLRELGMGQGWMTRQPCAALAERTCRMYDARPTPCRAFRCQLLEAVAADEVDLDEALTIVAEAHRLEGDAREPYIARHFRGRVGRFP